MLLFRILTLTNNIIKSSELEILVGVLVFYWTGCIWMVKVHIEYRIHLQCSHLCFLEIRIVRIFISNTEKTFMRTI